MITYPQQHYYYCGGSSLNRTANCIRISAHSVVALPFSITVYCSSQVNMLLYSNILVVLYTRFSFHKKCYVLLLYATYCLCTTKLGAANFNKTQLHLFRQPIVFMYYVGLRMFQKRWDYVAILNSVVLQPTYIICIHIYLFTEWETVEMNWIIFLSFLYVIRIYVCIPVRHILQIQEKNLLS